MKKNLIAKRKKSGKNKQIRLKKFIWINKGLYKLQSINETCLRKSHKNKPTVKNIM